MLQNLKDVWMQKECLRCLFWKLLYANFLERNFSSRVYRGFTALCLGTFPCEVRQWNCPKAGHTPSSFSHREQGMFVLCSQKLYSLSPKPMACIQFSFHFFLLTYLILLHPFFTFTLTQVCTYMHMHIYTSIWVVFILFCLVLIYYKNLWTSINFTFTLRKTPSLRGVL